MSASGHSAWFVLRAIHLGLENASGSLDRNAWRSIGFDLDDRITTADDSKTSANSCHRFAGSPTATLADGCHGIDNNFGAHVMQTIKSLDPGAEDDANTGYAQGEENFVLRIDGVADGDDGHAPGAFYRTTRTPGGNPRFDGTDAMKIVADALLDGVHIDQPIVTFPDGYIAQGTWVSGLATDRIEIPMRTYAEGKEGRFVLPVEHAFFALRLADGAGTIAGVGDSKVVVDALRMANENLGQICPGNATFDQIVTSTMQSVDLVLGAPSYQDVTVDCNAISIGLGILMAPAAPPTEVVSPVVPPPNLCDAGVDGG